MKATTEAAGSAIDKATEVATVLAIANVSLDFLRSSGKETYRFMFPSESLPVGDPAFVLGLLKCAATTLTHRSKEAKAFFPDKGGEVTAEMFTAAILAVTFRGDEKPSADDEKEAKRIMNSVEAKQYTAEDAAAALLQKYGWKVTPDLAGFSRHFMMKRVKEMAEKADKVDLAGL